MGVKGRHERVIAEGTHLLDIEGTIPKGYKSCPSCDRVYKWFNTSKCALCMSGATFEEHESLRKEREQKTIELRKQQLVAEDQPEGDEADE